MGYLLLIFAAAFVASLGLTRVVRSVARRWGIVDYPDGRRKLHDMPTPLWGGVAVYLALVLGLLVAGYDSLGAGKEQIELSTILMATAAIVCVFGAIDDGWVLSPRLKLVLQTLAVLPIIALGYYVDRVVAFGHPIELAWFGIPLTVLWLVGCINALNFLDGMDGLASTVGLLTAAMMAIIATSMGNGHVAVIAVALAGALGGFLVYNLPPASIFLGDSGSMVIGLVLGVLAIQGAMKTSATLAITVPAVIMSLPMLDVVLALVRRRLTGQRLDTADREHLHHRLLDRGLTQWQALCIIGAVCLTTGGAATAATIFRVDALAWITALGLLVALTQLRVFGHHELALAKAAVARRLAALAHQLARPSPTRRPSTAAELDCLPFAHVWAILTEEVKAWKVCRFELVVSRPGEHALRHDWTSEIPQKDREGSWSIGVSFRGGGGRVCRLLATVRGTRESEILYSAGLTRMLMVFATYFLKHTEQIPRVSSLDEEQTKLQKDSGYQGKAA